MSVIVILIAFSLLVAGGFLAAFFWAVRSGQYTDTYTPSVRILFENTTPPLPEPGAEDKKEKQEKLAEDKN